MKEIICIEMFSGIGGFRLGLAKANTATIQKNSQTRQASSGITGERNRRGLQPIYRCVWANDNDKYACQIYRKRFASYGEQQGNSKARRGGNSLGDKGKQPNQPKIGGNNPDNRWHEPSKLYEGDIRAVDVDRIPDHDLLCAGFPCQSFSIAGKRRGFEDTRGTLFFEICRVLRAKRPSYLLLENVKGLLSADNGEIFQTILVSLDELGYDLQWQVLNSKDFGVPQNRERVFIVGHLREKTKPKVFPIGEASQASSGYEQGEITGTMKSGWGQKQNDATYLVSALDSNYHKGIAGKYCHRTIILHKTYPGETREYIDESPTISTPSGGGHLPYVAQRWVRTEKGKQARRKSQKQGRDYTPFNEGHRELVESKEDISGCITDALAKDALIAQALQTDGQLRQGVSWGTDKPQSARNIRRLTPLECERLQGFPDGWTKGISDTQRYKCLGNAVTVNVIEAIGTQLLKEL